MSFLSTNAYAALQVIGSADYDSDGDGTAEAYKLIYSADLEITFLDYSNKAVWADQNAWLADLGSELTITLYDGYDATGIDWTTGWRLPETVEQVPNYNITSGEMGYLFYEELGNAGKYDINGNELESYGLGNKGDFDNLRTTYYWSGTEYSNTSAAWAFYFRDGCQYYIGKSDFRPYGMAVLSGEVNGAPVPLPGTLLLLGSGLLGLMGVRRHCDK
ncbi:MAG: PEP-CTERM sorting domain-containing protein [Desulfobacteraceae bacterium]